VSDEPVDIGDEPEWPQFTLNTVTNEVTVDWHGDRPEQVLITPASIEQIMENRNATMRELAAAQEKIKALEMLVAIFRLGRRPNKRDWEEAGMPQVIDPDVRIDIMRRKPA
jgi:hypothetical protein